MSTAVEVAEEWEDMLPQEIPRDRFGRPRIIPPAGGALEPYGRPSGWGGKLEDTYKLGEWLQRMVAAGLGLRPDLLLRVNSLGTEPPKLVRSLDGNSWVPNPRFAPWRKAMDETCTAAKDAAAAHAKATVGTSLHALCERIDRGEDVGFVPEQYLPHLASYSVATDGWRWLAIERFMVCDELKLAGTPDRVALVPGFDLPVIADIKTGSVDYGVGKMAVQLAVYAHSVLYDIDGTRTPVAEEVDQTTGLIIALDAVKGTCELLAIDLVAGWEGVQLAAEVDAWRKRRGLTVPYRVPAVASTSPPPPPAPTPARPPRPVWAGLRDLPLAVDVELVTAIRTAPSVAELEKVWASVHRQAWTADHTKLAAARKAELTP